ncbi:MAG TPA: hypothetical protein P5525_22575, partial [Candidatus Paceibacterota bacterium]|nr:hypothetical protein [Candidatus Paceibacterota bacterium]
SDRTLPLQQLWQFDRRPATRNPGQRFSRCHRVRPAALHPPKRRRVIPAAEHRRWLQGAELNAAGKVKDAKLQEVKPKIRQLL